MADNVRNSLPRRSPARKVEIAIQPSFSDNIRCMEPTNPESVPPVPPANPPQGTPPPNTPEPPAGSASSSLPPPMPGEPGSIPSQDERLWAMLIHISGLLGASLTAFFIPGNLVVPLILWLIKRDGHPFVNDQGKECLNFQITMTLVGALCVALTFVCIGFILLPILGIYALILGIIAAVKSYEGVPYRYPLTLRLIT